jgi:hypothetical protein
VIHGLSDGNAVQPSWHLLRVSWPGVLLEDCQGNLLHHIVRSASIRDPAPDNSLHPPPVLSQRTPPVNGRAIACECYAAF